MADHAAAPRRILLTGANGFVGRHLSAALARAYPETALLTEFADLRDPAAITALIAEAQPDVCIHLAAIATVAAARENEDLTWDVNLHGTLRLARALLRHAPSCRLLYVSSADAYGAGSGSAIDESVRLAPRNVYAASKAAADLAVGALAEQGLAVVRLRPFNHTGAGQLPDLVVAAFARQVARVEAGLQTPQIQVGNLESWRDFLDVRDVCAAYVACVARRDELAPGTILNIGSGQARRIGDILDELMALAGVTAEVRAEAARVRAGEAARVVADSSRASATLGWRPAIAWPQTLRDVLDDWRGRIGQE